MKIITELFEVFVPWAALFIVAVSSLALLAFAALFGFYVFSLVY